MDCTSRLHRDDSHGQRQKLVLDSPLFSYPVEPQTVVLRVFPEPRRLYTRLSPPLKSPFIASAFRRSHP
jgi:hypothetical protein